MVRITELRAFAQVKSQMDAATEDKFKPTGPMARWVEEVGDEILAEQYRARQSLREKPVSSSG